MNVSDAGRAKIIEREGVRLHPYKDTRGIPTIGIGNTTYPDGRAVTMADPPITRAQADQMFRATLDRFALGVSDALTRVPSQNQFDALVSFAFNIGIGGFGKSSVLAKFNAGDVAGAGKAFDNFHIPPEIIDRRNGERDQFLATPVSPSLSPQPVTSVTSVKPGPWAILWNLILSLFGRKT